MHKSISHYAIVLLNLAQRVGLDRDVLMHGQGLTPHLLENSELAIDNHQITGLIKRLWQHTEDEFFGLSSQPSPMGSWALACDFMLSAKTLGELYRRGQKIYRYLPPGNMQLSLENRGSDAIINIGCYIGKHDPNRFLAEFIGITWHRFPCWAIDEYVPLKAVHCNFPAPAHSWLYEELFQCKVKFNRPQLSFRFDGKYLARPVCRNNTELQYWLADSPADLLYIPGRDNSVANQIRKQLDYVLRQQQAIPAFETLCRHLCMSPPVVRRRLLEEGEQYQQIKDWVRASLIKELLTDSDLSISEITARSGFTEVASLTRAFKKWSGLTPVQYRHRHRKPE